MASVALQLLQMKDAFLAKKPTLSLKSSPTELKHYLDEFDVALADFQDVYNCLFQTKPEVGDPNLKLILKCEADLLLSFCKPDIQLALGREAFSNSKTIDELKNALKLAIGEEDEQVVLAQLKKQFSQMDRKVELNETFDCFITRLVKMAEKITSTDYKIDLVIEQFNKCLRPMDLEVIQLFPDQCTGTGIDLLRAKAKILDDRKYYSKVEMTSHQVEIEDVRRALESQVEKLTNQLSAQATQISEQAKLEQQHRERQESLTQSVLNRLEQQMAAQMALHNQLAQSSSFQQSSQPSVQTHLIHTAPKSANQQSATSKSTSGQKTAPKSENAGQKSAKRAWMDTKNYCYFCGGRKCPNKDKCQGNSKLYCMFCDAHGHSVTSKHFHGQPKN